MKRRNRLLKLIRKLVTGLMILLVALGSSPLEVFAYDPFNQFPDQTQREWPTENENNVATTLPEPPAMANTVNMLDMFHYPKLIYTGSKSDDRNQTEKLADNRSYVTATDSSVAVITRDARWQSGVMWSLEDNKIKLNEPFHMVAYVYLGKRTQHDRDYSGLGGLGGADGITFTMHNDKKTATDILTVDGKLASGSKDNKGMNAYGALGNGLGVYGSNFSANVSSNNNNMVDFWRGVENGITLEFDTFYNDNDTTQHSDNDLTYHIIPEKWKGNVRYGDEGHEDTKYGHIAINLLNDFKDNKANRNEEPNRTKNKHKVKLSLGWDGEVSEKTNPYSWIISRWPSKDSVLADGKWHRLEVTWTPNIDTNTGNLNYTIYKQGHIGSRNISQSDDVTYDVTDVITYDVAIGSPDPTYEYSLQNVFGVENLNNSVYWGFSGSTGGFLNNQAVQMLQLPKPYYKSGIRKVDQDNKLVKNAKFQLEVLNEGIWKPVEFQEVDGPGTKNYVLTGVDNGLIGVTTDLDEASPTYGKVTATQLLKGTYRWKEEAPAEGYQLDKIYYPDEGGFVVNYAESQKENAFQYTPENTKLSQIELYKYDRVKTQPLNGVKFTIFKKENSTNYYLKLNADTDTTATDFEWTTNDKEAKQFETGYSYFVRNGKIVKEEKKDGYIRIGYIENGADLGWEEEVPKGYDSSGSGKLTGVFEHNNYVYSAEQINSRLYQVSLEKKASDDPNAALPGAVFSLEQYDGDWKVVKVKQTTGENGKITFTPITPGEDGEDTIETDGNGKITISNLKAGKYRWEEKQAPVGYKIKQQYYEFDVQYREGLEIDDISQNYKYETEVINEPKDFVLTLEKLSSTFQKPLQGVKFELYDSDDSAGEPDFSNLTPKVVTTGADGKIFLNNGQIQADKTYYLVESDTVDGFILLKGYFIITTDKLEGFKVTYKADTETDESPVEFPDFLTEDGNNYKGHLKIYNKRKSILPETGGNGILGYVGIGLTMTIVALLFFIARKRIFKWLIILLVATSGLAGLAGGTQVVSAQEQEQVQLEVNRLVYQPSDRQYKSGVPVAGAKLEVVDVTKSFYELVNRQKLSLKEAQEAVSKSNKIDGQSLAVATTDQSGLVRFTVSKTSQQRPAVYLIRELVTPVAVTKMENMVVVLPILDESGNEKSLISLFPKSHGTFTFDKTIDEKQSSYSFGEPISYRLSTIIPQDMTNLSSYEIEDIYDQGLRFISESLEIFIDGEKQSDSIKAVSLSENQFRVVFDVAKLADFSGKKLEVTYQMVIKDEAAIDQDLVNTATLYPGDLSPLVDRENVQTGGFRFIKCAAEGKQNPLAKATFVIKNPTDDTVLTYKEGKYQFEKVATNASGVVRLTSDDDGYFEIRGLRYGEYLVNEIRAPSGYVLQDKPTAFTVGVSTYSQGPVLSIFNVKKPKIRLPETGTVATSTAFVGLLIMASSLVMIRRRKDN